MSKPIISPSILSANFLNIQADIVSILDLFNEYEVVTDEVEWYSAKELNEFNDPKEETINEMLAPVRKIGSDEVLNFEVSGDKIEAVHMLPGYTHNIINLSETENLVTVMWANEQFDPSKPDTFFEVVE